jgi:hypothetical protein
MKGVGCGKGLTTLRSPPDLLCLHSEFSQKLKERKKKKKKRKRKKEKGKRKKRKESCERCTQGKGSSVFMFGIFGKARTKLKLRPRSGDLHMMYVAVGVGMVSGYMIFGPPLRELQLQNQRQVCVHVVIFSCVDLIIFFQHCGCEGRRLGVANYSVHKHSFK